MAGRCGRSARAQRLRGALGRVDHDSCGQVGPARRQAGAWAEFRTPTVYFSAHGRAAVAGRAGVKRRGWRLTAPRPLTRRAEAAAARYAADAPTPPRPAGVVRDAPTPPRPA